jgi:hypothetical protein
MMISSFCVFRVANRYTFGAIFDRDLLDPALRERYRTNARRHDRAPPHRDLSARPARGAGQARSSVDFDLPVGRGLKLSLKKNSPLR